MDHYLSSSSNEPTEATVPRATRDMVHARTQELVLISGREAHQIRQSDYEQAKRELTGEWDFDRQQTILDQRY